jgi:hypothetical protein
MVTYVHRYEYMRMYVYMYLCMSCIKIIFMYVLKKQCHDMKILSTKQISSPFIYMYIYIYMIGSYGYVHDYDIERTIRSIS